MTDTDQREYRQAFLLLQLLQDDPLNRRKGELNKVAKKNIRLFGSKATVPNALRSQLVTQEHVLCKQIRGTQEYEITDSGRALLAELRHDPGLLNGITGEMINGLTSCFRNHSAQFGATIPAAEDDSKNAPPFEPAVLQPETVGSTAQQPSALTETKVVTQPMPAKPSREVTPDVLAETIISTIQDLHRTEFHYRSYVPIYAVRRSIADHLGEASSEPETFDVTMKALRNEGRIRLVPITDMNVPRDQLRDGIAGLGETLFYVEVSK